ncbi:MAG: hypothetical protein ABR991_12990 [Terracidiphilus sp.]|jgi:hypothetical protein
MNLSALDYILWAAGFFVNALLFAILVYRRRWREFPVFTAFEGFIAAVAVLGFLVYRFGSFRSYERFYWITDAVIFVFQLGVIGEIARIVLRPTGSWFQDAKKQFLLWGAAGILFAAALPWLVTPPVASWQVRLDIRADLFASLVICELIAVVTRTSKSLGLGWRNHVMALGNGWTLRAVTGILVDGAHCYLGIHHYYREFEHVGIFVTIMVNIYWIVQFWLEEPARQPISPELRAYIEALHQRIKNDLDRIEVQR